MDFKKYHSIENSYNKKFLDQINEEGHDQAEFVVQEKVHGACFSIWLDEDKTQCAKRSDFIKEDEKFFNYEEVKNKYHQQMRDLFESFRKEGASLVTVFGELYGGVYPHPDVPKISNQRCVQKGVYYNPEQDFIAFDLKVDGLYMSVDFSNKVFEKFGIPYCKTLFRGSLEDCLAYNNEYLTTIPKELGLPEIEKNNCEGNIIRPVEPIFLKTRERLILKNKNAAFAEKSGEYKRKHKKPKEVKKINVEAQNAVDEANAYITDNRLRNVISKFGHVENKDFGKLMSLFTQDIIDDFIKDNESMYNTLEKQDRKLVTKHIGQNAVKLLRKHFTNIVNGEF